MEKVLWTEQLSLGVVEIDEAHKKFLLQLAMVANMRDDRLGDVLFALIKDMEQDFAQEEALMEKIGYPDLRAHREQHARVLSSFHEVVPDVLKGDCHAAHHLLDLLPSWLVVHITTMDKSLVLYMQQHAATAGS
jgi:methyl-accepting chemotaxis protein